MAPSKTFRPKLKPGFDQSTTRLTAEGSWYSGDKVRFQDGHPENQRGWQRKHDTAFEGTARAMHAWLDLRGTRRVAVGTECLLQVFEGGTVFDITPVRASAVATSVVNTSADSLRVVVSAAHGMSTDGDHVVFSQMSATIGGNVFLSGRYNTSVIDANSFAVDLSSSAAATSAAAGVVTLNFLVTCGTSIATPGYGWGAGGYGEGTYGTPRDSTTLILDIQQWSFDNFGEDLIANIRGGGIYHWNASIGVSARASLVATAPSRNNFILISPEDRHLISFGGTDVITSVFDPLLVQWPDTESYTTWMPTVTNAAGSFRLTDGSKIMGAERSRGQLHIWTDNSLHAMIFTGPPFTFSNKLLGTNCGLAGPHSAIDVNGRSYWMGINRNFYTYDGRVRSLPCSVLDAIFDNLNRDQISKVYAGSNSEFSEIIWLYPSASATECDSYAIYNINDGTWYTGTFMWTAWVDQGVYDTPITAGTNHYLYDHEPPGVYTSDGQAIESYIETGDFDIEEGDSLLFLSKFEPDTDLTGGNLDFYITTRRYPNSDDATVKGPYTISAATGKISLRARGRQARLRFVTSAVSVSWRIGLPSFVIQSDGNR
jgi:hypothetical protein